MTYYSESSEIEGRTGGFLRWLLFVSKCTPTILVAAIIVARFPSTLFRAEFWAEDATEFFFDALSLGAKSLIVPVYGYHFLLERMIAYGATFFPVYYSTYIYSWAALLINSIAIAYIARDGFSWIAPRCWQRVLLAALFAVGPGTADVLLNLANLPSPLALLGFLLLVERPYRLGAGRFVALLLISASSGQMALWLPVVCYIAWLTRRWAYLALAATLIATAALNVAGNHQAAQVSGLLDYSLLAHVPRIVIENAFTRLILAPFLGPMLTGMLMLTPSTVFWSAAALGIGLITVLAVRESKIDRDSTAILILAYLGATGLFAIVAFSRNYALPQLIRESGSLHWHLRYSFLPSVIVVILWGTWLLRSSTRSTPTSILRAIAFALIIIHTAAAWPLRFARPDLQWRDKADRLQQRLNFGQKTGQHTILMLGDVAVHPVRWIPSNSKFGVVVPPN